MAKDKACQSFAGIISFWPNRLISRNFKPRFAVPDIPVMALPAVQTSAAASASVPFGNRAEIIPASPLPAYNAVGGPAYAARLKGDAASVMAILCNTGLPPRLDAINAMRNIDHPSFLRLLDSGVALWPSDGMRYFALAYQTPSSPRMKNAVDEPHAPPGEDVINHSFITPLIGALAELARTGNVHNAIRPTNIFWRLGGAAPPQLGECLSAPAGVGQPALFEPLERAMSLPLGRGPGTPADDSYAFGVTLALFILGQNLLKGLDDRAVIQAKMERGSFGALIGNTRLSPTHAEILRGLLADDARTRWTAIDLEHWLNGRRMTPRSADAGRRASRHIDFGGKPYWQTRPLAAAMAGQVAEAARAIESGLIDKWLRRAAGDEERANELLDAQSSLKEGGKVAHYEDQLVTRVCIALDPSAPIRYRGLSMMPGGIANMLAEALITNGNNLPALSEIIASQLVAFWVNMQKEAKTELVPIGQQFEKMRGLIEKTNLGNGIERVLYELNPNLPCLSPMLRSQYVTTPKALLAALERVGGGGGRAHEPMDRHIAAFLIAREKRSETLFNAMAAPDTSPRKGVALLTLFSEMQHRYGPDAVPNLAAWLTPFLEVSIRRYLGKSLKDKLQKQLREASSRGDLGTLLRLVDDPRRIEYDQQEFLAARLLYLSTLKEVAGLEASLANRNNIVQTTGKPIAAAFSSFLAILLVMAAILRAIWLKM
ncbi:MAG: serine/threonine protein kinase [Alphaproteobacteria bacterium]|nr:serine/threonine protein kinase [Alphaproteobacteria bacterium]